jgi:hypothetical protein
METSTNITFCAIKEFVSDLWEVFGPSQAKSALALYHRLIQHVEAKESAEGLEKYITGFKVFFVNYSKELFSVETLANIARGTVIRYGSSDKIFIEIQKYVYKATPSQKEIIRQHLLTISATIDPNDETLGALDAATPILEKMGLNNNSPESKN